MRTPLIVIGAVLVAFVAGCSGDTGKPTSTSASTAAATDQIVRLQIAQSSLGPILTDQDGRTLYAFANDKDGTSTCTSGECVATWPALLSRQTATAGPGVDKALLKQTTRAEGTVQVTYNDWPLYYYVPDVGPGDVDGQAVDGVWFVLSADGKLVKTNP